MCMHNFETKRVNCGLDNIFRRRWKTKLPIGQHFPTALENDVYGDDIFQRRWKMSHFSFVLREYAGAYVR